MRQRGRGAGAPTGMVALGDARPQGSDDMSASGSTDDAASTSDGSRGSRLDDESQVVSCTVVYDHRFVRLRIAVHDTVESLVELTAIKLRKKYPNENLGHAVVGLRSQRLEKDLYLNTSVEDVVMEGDILEVRPYTIAQSALQPNRSTRFQKNFAHTASSSQSVPIPRLAISTFGATARPGVFTVTPIKGEGLPIAGLLRIGRASLGVRLFPYEEVVFTPPAIGPDFMWGAPIHFKHTDTSREQLLLHIQLTEDPIMGARNIVGELSLCVNSDYQLLRSDLTNFGFLWTIGTAILPLQSAIDTPGTTITKWIDMKKVDATSPTARDGGGRLMVSACFHPKVSKGPTLQKLLHDIVQEEQQRVPSPTEKTNKVSKPGFKLFLRQGKKMQSKLQSVINRRPHRRAKGRLTFSLNGIHLCSSQCSKVNGHSISSSQDFAPIVRIKFDDFEDELRVGMSDCDLVNYEHEWSVYSCFSHVEVEVLRKVALSAGSVQRLRDGSQAVKVCSATISCHEIQERNAASWTFDPPEPALGPGRSLPLAGFNWYSLCIGDDEIGLAHIRAEYKEDYLAILDTEESPDLSYIYPDERSFDPMIIHRNFERLDEVYMIVKSLRSRVTELLEWRNPVRTLAVWIVTTVCCIYVPASNLPLLFTLAFVIVLVGNYAYFLTGYTHKKWIQRVNGSSGGLKAFRPVGTLRIVPVSAVNLKTADGSSANPDTYVRIFYEPNYKTIPVHLIAQTECARSTRNPVWSVSQDGAKNRDDFLKMNNRWLKAMFRHLSSHEQDAIAHDVVEPWSRVDGEVDTHAFKYPVLQPVQKEPTSTEEELIEWRNCPGTVRFDVMQENVAAQPVLVGRVRIPIKCLVSDEAAGGPQVELEQTFPLVVPAKLNRSKSICENDRSLATDTPSLIVRMQLFLRDPRSRVTLKESLASEALYNVIEMESQRELTLVEKYHKAKDVAKNIQQTLGSICSTIERTKNLFLWVHPMKTLLVLVLALLTCAWFYLIPMRYILVYTTAKWFTKKFHKIEDLDMIRLQNLICTVPSDLDMRRIYNARNQEFLRLKEHTETQAKLQAEWAGYLWKQGEGVFNAWQKFTLVRIYRSQERYCAVRSGRLEYWQSITDAKSGIAPKGAIVFSNVIEKCSRVESLTVPKDAYPLAIFDVSRRILVYSPRGRRRLICAKTEEDYHLLERAIYRTGERISVSSITSPAL